MKYELKSVSPGSVFWNALRLFSVMGLLVAIYHFYMVPNPDNRLGGAFQKLMATGLFTVVYAFVISMVFLMIGLLYNGWTQEFQIKPFFLQALRPALIAGGFLGIAYAFITLTEGGFMMRCLITLLATAIFTPLLAIFITIFTAAFNAIFGQFKGVSVNFDQK